MQRVHRVIAAIEPHDSAERYTSLGVECLEGSAKIISPWAVQITSAQGVVQNLTTKNIVIAAGARPLLPPIPGLADMKPLTSDNVWELKVQPKRLLVLGGGPIGCELAQAFSRLGCQVTQVEMASRLMLREDVEVSEYVAKQFLSEGIDVRLNHKAQKFEVRNGAKTLIAQATEGKTISEVAIEFDEVLCALGRVANVTGYGLEEMGITLSGRKTVEVNEFLQTKYPNIFAAGDVAGPYQFTHTAAHMAWYAAVNGLFGKFKKFSVDYSVIPWATFTEPEVARVGLNELEAKEKGIAYEITHYGIDDLDRAIADESAEGFVKVLTVPGKDKILGVTIVGEHAGDLIAEFVLAMRYKLGLNKILGTIHIYPTLAEANKYAAGNWKKAHAPEKLLSYVQRFHAWQRS
jgi:pyruvate/2-oxoglutarate dehydrogenase complex dihydrolipoamide dehydrogenase (E3) component